MGASGARPFLRPLFGEGQRIGKTRVKTLPRERERVILPLSIKLAT